MSDFFSMVPAAPRVEPLFDIGGIFSIPTGKIIDGANGRKHLNAGFGAANSIQGLGNTFKTGILLYMALVIVSRYLGSKFVLYDAESSFQWIRLQEMLNQIPGCEDIDVMNNPSTVYAIVKGSAIYGDQLFDQLKKYAKDRKDSERKVTPFMDENGEFIKSFPFLNLFFDSFTATKISTVVANMEDKFMVGDSKGNTADMKESNAKSKLVHQMPGVNYQGGVIFTMVAQLKKTIVMDQYAADTSNMAYSTRGVSTKGVSGAFGFINNNLWEIKLTRPCHNGDSEKSALYPMDDSDKTKGTVDLQEVVMVQTRNKNGSSGFMFNLIFSQAEGFQPYLTCFHYIHKCLKVKYGFQGNNTSYSLDLLPEQTIRRTTVRNLCRNNVKFQRAVEITTHLAQMSILWKLPEQYKCSTAELYADLKAMGFDWDELLDTRGFWTFNEDDKKFKPELIAYDLLRMRAGEYVPHWLKTKPLAKAT